MFQNAYYLQSYQHGYWTYVERHYRQAISYHGNILLDRHSFMRPVNAFLSHFEASQAAKSEAGETRIIDFRQAHESGWAAFELNQYGLRKGDPRLRDYIPHERLLAKLAIPPELRALLMRPETLLLISVSGGKDSDAQAILLVQMARIEGWRCQIRLIHCDTGMEWFTTRQHLEALSQELALSLKILERDGQDLIAAIRARMKARPDVPPFPSAKSRYCTSSFKRDTSNKYIRELMPSNGIVILSQGLRAEESKNRQAREVFAPRPSVNAPSLARQVYDWLPIHQFSLADVWETIGYSLEELETIQAESEVRKTAGEDIFAYLREIAFLANPAYALKNSRLSCALCILSKETDLLNGALHNPDIYLELCRIELESGYSFQPNKWLCALRPEILSDSERQRFAELQKQKPIAQNSKKKNLEKAKQLPLFPF